MIHRTIEHIINHKLKEYGRFDPSKLKTIPLVTTNLVFIYDKRLVFKKLKNEQSFYSEFEVYNKRNDLNFRIPELIHTLKDEEDFFWIVLEYIDSVSLLKYPEIKQLNLKSIVEKVVSAIAEFEIKFHNNPKLGIKKWSLSESLAPLLEKVKVFSSEELVNNLNQAILNADNLVSGLEHRPCFDAFLNNILITKGSKQELIIYFCDFDKAYRSVPMGEQLTHFLLHVELSFYSNLSIDLYSKLTGHSKNLVEKTINITSFGRALSALRDNSCITNKTQYKIIPIQEYELALSFIKYAKSFLREFSEAVSLKRQEENGIKTLLKNIETHISTNHQ